jgi:NAD(P)-dependent dehydrogenase (short-subunit alcohol dehydrogenase family)
MGVPKTVLITGTSSGFGELCVFDFLAKGWHVLATLRNAEQRRASLEKKAPPGSLLTVLELDVTLASDRQAVAHYLQEHFDGRLDCLVNNAGYGHFGALETASEADVRHQMEINFFGLLFLTQALLPALRKAQGRILNISSIIGRFGMPLTSLYCASKFAVDGFSESLYYELAPQGVQVCVVNPGAFRTRFRENVQWASLQPSDSPYTSLTQGYQKRLESLSQKPGKDPSALSRLVVQLAEMPRMPMRVLCGSDAKMGAFFLKILPRSWFNRLLKKRFQEMLNPHES